MQVCTLGFALGMVLIQGVPSGMSSVSPGTHRPMANRDRWVASVSKYNHQRAKFLRVSVRFAPASNQLSDRLSAVEAVHERT